MGPRHAVQVGQRRDLARHAVDAVDGDHRRFVLLGDQQLFQRAGAAGVQFAKHRAVGRRDLGRLLDAVVRKAIDHQQVAAAGDGGDQPGVGKRDAGIDQRIVDAEPSGQPPLGLVAELDAGECAGRPVMGSPRPDGVHQRPLDIRMAIQAEKAVGAEIPQLSAPDGHAPPIVHFLDDQVLEMGVVEVVEEAERQPRDAIAAEVGLQAFDPARLGQAGNLAWPARTPPWSDRLEGATC